MGDIELIEQRGHDMGESQLSSAGLSVLQDIYSMGGERALILGRRLRVPTPSATELFSYCELLAKTPLEEELQTFLEEHPGFLTGLLGTPDNADLAVLFKPPLGARYRADFCILQAHQGGCVANLIEIESSHEPLFTKKGTPARRLAAAATQIEDWRIFVARDPKYHAGELIALAQKAPLLSDYRRGDIGFRLRSADDVASIWRSFGGDDEPFFHFVAVLGRWSSLSNDEKARVLNRNRSGGDAFKIYTFEQVARSANFRLERDEWFNESDQWGSIAAPIVEANTED